MSDRSYRTGRPSGDLIFGRGGRHHRHHRGPRGGWGVPWAVPIYPELELDTLGPECIEWNPAGECQKYGYPPGVTVLGLADLQKVRRELDGVKPVTNQIARVMLRAGQEAIGGAILGAEQPWYKKDLPGDTARKNTRDHLKWHADHIGTDPQALYGSADDLKKWVAQAYIEANAVEEGAAYLEAAWQRMWSEIRAELARLPKKVLESVGVPTWAFWTGTAVIAGLAGWLIYKRVRG